MALKLSITFDLCVCTHEASHTMGIRCNKQWPFLLWSSGGKSTPIQLYCACVGFHTVSQRSKEWKLLSSKLPNVIVRANIGGCSTVVYSLGPWVQFQGTVGFALLSFASQTILSLKVSLVQRPLPDFISQPWRKIARRPEIKTTSRTGNGGLGQYVRWTWFVLTKSTISSPWRSFDPTWFFSMAVR